MVVAIFVYLGGDQVVPNDVTHAIVDKSVKIIPRGAFRERRNLLSVETHDGVEIIEEEAFYVPFSPRNKIARRPGNWTVGIP